MQKQFDTLKMVEKRNGELWWRIECHSHVFYSMKDISNAELKRKSSKWVKESCANKDTGNYDRFLMMQ